jgi:hypothetical protein
MEFSAFAVHLVGLAADFNFSAKQVFPNRSNFKKYSFNYTYMKNHLLRILFPFIITTSLCQAQDPTLWGMTPSGGSYSAGTMTTSSLITHFSMVKIL